VIERRPIKGRLSVFQFAADANVFCNAKAPCSQKSFADAMGLMQRTMLTIREAPAIERDCRRTAIEALNSDYSMQGLDHKACPTPPAEMSPSR